MDISRMIERGARNWGSQIAVVSGEERFTFEEVDERSNRLANGLSSLGCRPGSHIGVLLNNCHQYIEAYFGKYKANMVWITLSLRLNDDDLVWQINDSEIEVLIVGEEFLEKIASLRPRLEQVKRYITVGGVGKGFINYEELLAGSRSESPAILAKKDDLTRIAYTGGTTGRPKGIMIPRSSDEAVMRNMLLDNVPDLNRRDVFMGLQPLFHAVWTYVLPCWVRGARQVVTPHWSPEAALETIQREKVTVLKTVPTVLIRLLNSPDLKRYDLSSLRTLIYGAAPMPTEKVKEGIKLLGQIFVQSYGQAEAPMTIATLPKEDHVVEGTPEAMDRLASVGRPYTFVDVRVVDNDGRDVQTGELGEVIVSGDHIMTGYWHQPEEVTGEKLKDGWVHTGDIGRFDPKGYLYLVDRKNEMIITGGLNVYPNEVEQVLYQHPAVQEAAVIGIPDEEWGESVKAIVALKPGMKATEEELLQFCGARMTRYKRPKSVEFRESLPKSGIGKISRKELREPYWKGRKRAI